jgi:hypothetical protein
MMRLSGSAACLVAVMVCGLAGVEGCAQRALTTSGATVRATSQIEATLLSEDQRLSSPHHTLLLLKGAKRRFEVLTGPLDGEWFTESGRDPATQPASAFSMSGQLRSETEPAWEIDDGYSMMWGIWPVAWTPTTSIGAEGTTVFVLVEGNTEYVVLVDGRKATLRKRAILDPQEPVLATIDTVDSYVKIVAGVVVAGPIPVPTAPSDPLRGILNRVQARRAAIEH